MEYTTVLGVDRKHLDQLRMVWKTWVRFKPSILRRPMIIFYDYGFVDLKNIIEVVKEHSYVRLVPWPPSDTNYFTFEDKDPETGGKWTSPQRYKMLSGFVHLPGKLVETSYWLKLDTDTIAVGMDPWIDERWFDEEPAIISHPWGYTKPPNQMTMLDQWAEKHVIQQLVGTLPLNLKPSRPDGELVRHKRIISWCAFFNTDFTRLCSEAAEETCGRGMLPVPSQDGFLWYMATRQGYAVKRQNMKSCGWVHRSSMKGIASSVADVMSS